MPSSSARHRELLSAFEEDDPLVAGLQSKITRFQRKQKKQTQQNREYHEWASTQKHLNGLEEAISKQILQAGSNALEYMHKEKDHERLYASCGVDPSCRANAIESIQEDLAVLRTPVSSLCNAATTPDDVSKSLKDLDAKYTRLHEETAEHRSKVMALLSAVDEKIEQSQKVDRIRAEIDERSKKTKASIETTLKSKELQLRLSSMRLEQEEVQMAGEEKRAQATAKTDGEELEKEAELTKRILESKRALMNRQAQHIADGEESGANKLRDDFSTELQSQKQRHVIRDRTNYRQEQVERKLKAQKKAADKAVREEEMRIERLNSLATQTPYYSSIMNQSSDIHKSTQARKNDIYDKPKLADFQSGNLKSFTNDRVFADANFRLGNALHEAGLAHTAYARDVVREAIPRTEARTTGIQPF